MVPARAYIPAVLLCGMLVDPVASQEDGATCQTCHAEQAEDFSQSVHARAALRCQDCHGGEQTYAQPLAAGQFDHGASFTGKVKRLDIPERCAQCHSDVALMNPYGLPADQLARYRTSGHGQALYKDGNTEAAVCTDCHNVHAIFSSHDPRSRTNPLNVPDTCARCHGNAALMSKYGHDAAVVQEYLDSVHGKGLLEEHDTGMPTCATCHGNHAAAPPGVSHVDAVCGRCHMQSEQYFLQSPHAAVSGFPRCIGCHGGDHGHHIQRQTINPMLLSARLAGLGNGTEGEELIPRLHPGLELLRDICYECHDEDSDDPGDLEALRRSLEVYREIGMAEIAYARTYNRVEQSGRGMLLVEDEYLMLSDAKTALIELGPTHHTLDLQKVRDITKRLNGTIGEVQASLDRKQADLSWRYRVLWPMWAFIIVFAIASYIRYRQLKAEFVKPLPH